MERQMYMVWDIVNEDYVYFYSKGSTKGYVAYETPYTTLYFFHWSIFLVTARGSRRIIIILAIYNNHNYIGIVWILWMDHVSRDWISEQLLV